MAQAAKAIEQARAAIDETKQLIKKLRAYVGHSAKFDLAAEKLGDTCYAPDSVGGTLQSVKELKKVFAAFNELKSYVESLGNETNTVKRVQELYGTEVRSLEWMVEDWTEHLQETTAKEFKLLKKALLAAKNEEAQIPLLRQLQALQLQCKRTAQELCRKNTQLPLPTPLPPLRSFIEKARQHCLVQQEEIAAFLANYDLNHLPTLTYGSPEWTAMAKNRPVPEKGFAEKTIQKIANYTEPENWSEGMKRAVYNAFTLMQLTSDAFKFYNQIRPPTRELAEWMSQKAIESISPEESRRIEREAKTLKGFLTGDKIEQARRGEFDRKIKETPHLRQALEEAVKLFPDRPPAADELERLSEAYILNRQFSHSSANPYHHLSFSEWWQLFSTPQAAAPQAISQETKPVLQIMPPKESKEVGEEAKELVPQMKMSSPVKVSSMLSSIFQRATRFFSETWVAADLAVLPVRLLGKTVEGYDSLKETSRCLQELQNVSLYTADQELSNATALLEQELKRVVSETPDAHATLLEVADWMQAVEDKNYAVKILHDQYADQVRAWAETVPEVKSPLTPPVSHAFGSVQDALNLFLDGPPLAIDQRKLLHLILNIAGKESGLEGNLQVYMMAYGLELIQAKIQALNAGGICDDAAKQQLCAEIFPAANELSRQTSLKLFHDLEAKMVKALDLTRTFQASERKFHKKLRTEVTSLAAGNNIFFGGGWAGHAIVYEVIKQQDGKLTLRIYNTGGGINYFKRAVVGTDTLYMPFEEILDIPEHNFLHPVTLASLYQLENDKNKLWPLNANHLMKHILPELGGRISDKIYTTEELREPQQSGVCTWFSLVAAFSQQLGGQPAARHFEFETQLKAISDFDHLHADTYATDWQTRNLMKAGLAVFSSMVEGQWKPYLSDNEREIALSRILSIQQKIAAAEAEQEKRDIVSVPPLFNRVEKAGKFSSSDADVAPQIGPPVSKSQPSFYKQISLNKDWKPNPLTFFEDAQKIMNHARWYMQSGFTSSAEASALKTNKNTYRDVALELAPENFLNANEGIKEFVQKIPIDDAKFWQQLPKEQAGELARVLVVFSKEFFFNLVEIGERDLNRTKQIKGSDYLTLYKLLSAADKAARISGILGNFPHLIRERIRQAF